MNNIFQQHFNDYYMMQCKSPYLSNIYPNNYVNMLKDTANTGFISLNIIDQQTKKPISYATITVYVTDGTERDIPIMHLITTLNPVRIELPMAYDVGTQIVGPEYKFSTYNLRVDAFGYFANIVYNIRLFPNTTTDFNIEMTPVSIVGVNPNIEERTNIPPHPRDIIPVI